MNAIVDPIHIAHINDVTLRFFRSPAQQPELPWHAMDDLFLVCGFNRAMRRDFLCSAQRAFGDDIKTVATASGPITIAPHVAAQALLGAAVEVRFEMRPVEEAYTFAASEALKVLAGDLPPEALFRFLMTAARNSGIGGEA